VTQDRISASDGRISTDASKELQTNLDYARDLVSGGRRLEQLRVGAFDVADLYRAAWVQVVASLDHWVHRELYDRALGFAANVELQRPKKYLQIQVPMSLFEGVHHHAEELSEAFEAQLQIQFGHLSFQAPDKIKQALAYVSDIPSFWSKVAMKFDRAGGTAYSSTDVTERLSAITRRRNRIAHEADRDPARPGHRTTISDAEVSEAINWIEQLASAILRTIGPPPPLAAPDAPSGPGKTPKTKWTSEELYSAAKAFDNPAVRAVATRLLEHANQNALIVGGTGAEPSCGAYYWFEGNRRSLWSLYLTPKRPAMSLNFWSIRAADETLARRMLETLRAVPEFSAVLPETDSIVARGYVDIALAAIAAVPNGVETVLTVVDIAASS
jgi:hypothetical protein